MNDSFAEVWETFGKEFSLFIVLRSFIEFIINSSTQCGSSKKWKEIYVKNPKQYTLNKVYILTRKLCERDLHI